MHAPGSQQRGGVARRGRCRALATRALQGVREPDVVRRRHPPQQLPRRRLAHKQVRVARRGLPHSRHGDADAQAAGNQVEQHVEFGIEQRHLRVIPGYDRRGCRSRGLAPIARFFRRIRAAAVSPRQHGVGAGHCDLSHERRKHRVAHIDEAGDVASLWYDQHVPVVGVVVDHLMTQVRQSGHDPRIECVEQRGHESAFFRIAHRFEPGA